MYHNFLLLCLLFALSCHFQSQDAGNTEKKWDQPTDRKVSVRRTEQGFQLFRNGARYYINGASGGHQLEWVKRAGGNSVRVYDTEGLDTLLDRAAALDLSVMVDLYVGRAMEGFDYHKEAAVAAQKERIKTTILKYKNHPALLLWAVGNEPDNATEDVSRLWPALNELIRMIHELDPDHPVTIPVYPQSVPTVLRACPDIDLISINAFSSLPEFVQTLTQDIPYIVSEFSSGGPWEEENKTYWFAPIEPSIDRKRGKIRSNYQQLRSDSGRCLGSFVFYWGQKQEYTSSWFSFFSESGQKTPLVDLMFELWSNRQAPNRAPLLLDLGIDAPRSYPPGNLQAGEACIVSVQGKDPDGDPLKYRWEVIPDGPFDEFIPGKSKREIRPKAIELPDFVNEGNRFRFTVPDRPGPYRIYVYAEDGQGNSCSANLPVFFVNESLR